jgi:O-antigen/teichoic acid export membrane protein
MRLFSNVSANIFQFAFSSITLFVLYKLVAIKLGLSLLGVWSVVIASTSIARLGEMGLAGSVTQHIAKDISDESSKKTAFTVETALLSAIGVVSLIILFAFRPLQALLGEAFSGTELGQALNILPHALAFMGIGLVAMILQGVLDGLQQMWSRAIIISLTQALMIILSFVLIDNFGIVSVMYAQIIQVLTAVILMWLVIWFKIPGISFIPYRWKFAQFKMLMPHAVNLQISSGLVMMVDPLVKIMIAKSGGAHLAGLFEIAHQVVSKARALIVTANQASVPHIAALSAVGELDKIKKTYINSLNATFYLSIPLFLLIILMIPVVSTIMTGAVSEILSLMILVCSITWLLNAFTVPSYFVNTSDGNVKFNTIGHLITGGMVFIFFVFFNGSVTWPVVILMWGSAIVLGGCFSLIMVHKRYSLNLTNAVGSAELMLGLLVTSSFLIAFGSIFYDSSYLYYLNIIVVLISSIGSFNCFKKFRKNNKK